ALGDDAAVQSRSEVVGPRTWRVGAGDYVFARFVVEVAVLHWTSSQLRATDYRSGEPPRNVSRPLDLLRLHVPPHDLVRRSVVDDAALVKPDGAVAEGGDGLGVVAHEEDGAGVFAHLFHLLERLGAELGIARC